MMNNQISTIITLYKTPGSKLKNLKIYKNYKLHIFEQEAEKNSEKKLKKILKFKFKYFSSDKNIGLSKASNFLINNISSKYCLFTQADIQIDKKDIVKLKNSFSIDKNIIFTSPKFNSHKIIKNKIEYVNKINLACIMIDVEKIKKIGFFDEDYFLYWEDIQLIDKINKSKYKMVVVNDTKVKHESSSSSENNLKTYVIRILNYTYGDFLFDYKQKRLRLIKIIRIFFKNFVLFFFHILFFQFKKSVINFSKVFGTLKFILFIFKKVI